MALAMAHYRETQLWLANALEETAIWRDDKAAEYPDDPRNQQAAVALRQAAYYLRSSSASPGIARIAGLVDDSLASGIDLLEGSVLPGDQSERIAGRYRFDRFGDPVTSESHEELLSDLYDAILRDLSSHDVTPGSPLARRLLEEFPPLATKAEPRDSSVPGLQIERLHELSRIADLLVELADTARREEGPDGRLPQLMQPTRLPLVRRRLGVALATARALGVNDLEVCRKVVEEPPIFATQTVSAALLAVEEVQRAADREAA